MPHNHQRNIKDCEAGFTLMELIIVTLLAAIFLSLTIPTLRKSLYTDEVKTSAREIIGTVKGVRDLAKSEQKAYLLHFDIGENQIWYEADGNKDFLGDQAERTGEPLPDGVQLDEVRTHSKGSKSLGSMTVWISKHGYMDQTAVYISDGDDEKISLLFSPFSSLARVYDGYVEAEE